MYTIDAVSGSYNFTACVQLQIRYKTASSRDVHIWPSQFDNWKILKYFNNIIVTQENIENNAV